MQVFPNSSNLHQDRRATYPALRSFRRHDQHIRFPDIHFNPPVLFSFTLPFHLHTIGCLTDRSRTAIPIEKHPGQPSLLFANFSQVGQAFRSSPHSCDLTLAFRIISYSKTFRNTSSFLGGFQRPDKPRPILCTTHEPVRRYAIRARLAG